MTNRRLIVIVRRQIDLGDELAFQCDGFHKLAIQLDNFFREGVANGGPARGLADGT